MQYQNKKIKNQSNYLSTSKNKFIKTYWKLNNCIKNKLRQNMSKNKYYSKNSKNLKIIFARNLIFLQLKKLLMNIFQIKKLYKISIRN